MANGTNTAPAPSGAPAKKNNTALIIIIIVVVVVVIGVVGIFIRRWLVQRAAEKTASGILSATTGSNVDISESGVKWPADMPSDVPQLTAGKITMATSDKTSNTWSVLVSDVKQSDYDAYKAKVVAAGWSSASETTYGATYDEYENASYTLGLVFDSSSSTLSISVTTKS